MPKGKPSPAVASTLAASEPRAEIDLTRFVELPARYTDEGLLGQGGMGSVRKVRDSVLHRSLAMKIIHPALAAHHGARARFLREAQITAGLQHPSIVAVHDQGVLPDGRCWYTMQAVGGRTLGSIVADAPLRRLVDAVSRVAQAVGYAHEQGIIHRDLKPSNIMVGAFGEVLVLDWGLARYLDESDAPGAEIEVGVGLTQLGSVVGTPRYMSPEQAAGAPVGPPTDVYGLGAILHTCLTGHPPGSSEAEFAGPPILARVCRRALATEPTERPESAMAFASALSAWLDGDQRRAEAEAIIRGARAMLAPIEAAHREVERLERQAAVVLAPLASHAAVEHKAPGWALEAEATARAREVRLLEIELIQKARGALERAPDLGSAHRLLADLYRRRAERADERRDVDAFAENLALLEAHDRGAHAEWIWGTGRLTLHTSAPNTTFTLRRVVEVMRRLQPGPPIRVAEAPWIRHPVEPGSYVIDIDQPGAETRTLPVYVERGEDWHAGPPDAPDRPIRLPGPLGPDECWVPAGWFIAGGDPHAPDGFPRRRVWVPDLVMQRYAVSNRDYIAFLNALVDRGLQSRALELAPKAESAANQPARLIYRVDARGAFQPGTDDMESDWQWDFPVVNVTWQAARAYADWLGERDGCSWRLPHELEWEKAARGVDGRLFPWGDHFEPTWTNALGSLPGRPRRVAVDAMHADSSPFGISGMAGNSRDWCLNAFSKTAPADRSVVAFGSPGLDEIRAVRGGADLSVGAFCRPAARFGARPHQRRSSVGFRLVRPVMGQMGST